MTARSSLPPSSGAAGITLKIRERHVGGRRFILKIHLLGTISTVRYHQI
jgi:hypothetical protein